MPPVSASNVFLFHNILFVMHSEIFTYLKGTNTTQSGERTRNENEGARRGIFKG